MTATVYLIGAGPGDPALISVRGAAILAEADVVVDSVDGPPEITVGRVAEAIETVRLEAPAAGMSREAAQ